MEKTIEYNNLAELPLVAKQIIDFGKAEKIWIFEGEMGAGKTTTITAICKELGVTSHIQSPTFSLVNEYETTNREIIYHFDFYRIKQEIEAMDMGVEEYLYSGNLCMIEWASKIENLLPLQYLKIKISTPIEFIGGIETEKRIVQLTICKI
jgi:tRNA threonylcarbamoyladenosine biosynthesis protein TsaE